MAPEIRVKNAKFIFGSPDLSATPNYSLPEVAVIGRSNVGKSSFLNRLANNKKLARSSSTPGRTKEFNFFEFNLEINKGGTKKVIFTDLPGYGFAKFAKTERERLSKLTVKYLENSENLEIICQLNDCRRMPEREEIAMQQLSFNADKRFFVILTKADKLKKSEINKQVKLIADAYNIEAEDVILSGDGISNAAFWQRLHMILL